MIKKITWEEIYPFWKNYLWPERQSKIEPKSAMLFLGGYSTDHFTQDVDFFGYYANSEIVGVNSGHICTGNQDNSVNYRSRGLWVNPQYRNRGIGQQLLLAAIDSAKNQGFTLVWSYPRQSSWLTYQATGFSLASEWHQCEGNINAYCFIDINSL